MYRFIILTCIILTSCAKKQDGILSSSDKIYIVKKTTFSDNLKLRGSLNASKNVIIKSKLKNRFNVEITSLIADQTPIKKGDTILTLSGVNFDNEIEKLNDQLKTNKNKLEDKINDLQREEIFKENAITTSLETLQQKTEIFNTYINEGFRNEYKVILAKIEEKNNEVKQIIKEKDDKEFQLIENNDESKDATLQQKITTIEKKYQQKNNEYDQLILKKKRILQIDFPKKKEGYLKNIQSAKKSLLEKIVEKRTKLRQLKDQIKRYKGQIVKTQKQIEELEKEKEKLIITASVDGVFNWGDPNPRKSRQELAVGQNIRFGQQVGYIPDLSKFVIKTQIPENYRTKIKKNMSVNLTSEAVTKFISKGKIFSIATFSINKIYWDKNSPKVYLIEIASDTIHSDLSLGMTIDIEIPLIVKPDSIVLPIEAVLFKDGEYFCKLIKGKNIVEQKIKITDVSATYVRIIADLKEGDKILLF